ncbi:MAG TPA: hypothetical protein VFB38_20805 [Chthonomonadaceae bacterium]|nr:hypothetical protein [Chthonomonadaceae bacterium]
MKKNTPPDMPSLLPSAPEASASGTPAEEKTAASLPPLAAEPPLHARNRAERAEGWRALLLGLSCLLFWKATLLIPSGQPVVVWTTTLLYLLITLCFTVQTARALRSPASVAFNLCLSGALALPSILVPLLAMRFPEWHGWVSIGPFFLSYQRALMLAPGLHGLLLIWFATSIGVGLSRAVREVKLLLPMAVALALVDLYVVYWGGLVAQATSGHSQMAQAAMQTLTVKMPRPLTRHGAAPMGLAVGFADFLFIALFFACFARFGIPSGRTFGVLCGVLAVYMLAVGLIGWDLPALVPVGVVVIGLNWRRFRYERSEAFALLYAALIALAVVAGLYFLSHR